MKLLVVAPAAHTLGGLASWLDYLVPGLRRQGWNVTLGLVEGPTFHRPERYLALHPDGQWLAIPCRSGTVEGRCRAIEKGIGVVAPDLVLAVNIPDVYPAVYRLRQRGHRVSAAMALHNIESHFHHDIRRWAGVISGVICPNRLTCVLSERLGNMARERVHYAPCGVAVPVTVAASGVRDGGRLRIAYVGRLEEPRKRLGDIRSVLERLAGEGVPFEVLIAGSGTAEAWLRADLAAMVCQGYVRFLGPLDAGAVREKVYAVCDALLLPSQWETGPIVVWEALAAGVSVVASRYVGSGLERALIHNETALMFPVGDVAAAAANLARLWRERALRRHLASNGRALVETRYSEGISIHAWASAMLTVLSAELPSGAAVADDAQPASGRLDRCFGPRLAETIRQFSGRTGQAGDAGGEWPHSYGMAEGDDEEFWKTARDLDATPVR